MNKQIALLAVVGVLVAGSAGIYSVIRSSSGGTVSDMHALLAKTTPGELVKNSAGVVLGTVEKLDVARIPSSLRPAKEDIVTNATINVEKYLSNPDDLSAPEVTVQVIGGTIGGDTVTAMESPSFKVGDRVIVFLNKKDDGKFTVYGWAQGKYTVDSNNTVAVGNESTYLQSIFGKEHMTLDEFENAIASDVPQE